jgi:predicted glycoside hydrolase/deacetylase ChbG (UPF0249 family)
MQQFSDMKRLIVNADDFGLSSGVNEGIVAAHVDGIVTSASLMVRWPAAPEAAALARAHPRLSVGLHVDLCEWSYVGDEWRRLYEVVPIQDAAAVGREIERQLAEFRRLVGRDPTHLDSHQHVHREEPAHSILLGEARRLGVVLRSCDELVRYRGDFYGQSNKGYACHESISVEALLQVIASLEPGVTEMGCHPARRPDMEGMYRQERLLECETLCDPRVRAGLEAHSVRVCSFAELRG